MSHYSTDEAVKKLQRAALEYSVEFTKKHQEFITGGVASLTFHSFDHNGECTGTIRMIGRVLIKDDDAIRPPIIVTPHVTEFGGPYGFTPSWGPHSLNYSELFVLEHEVNLFSPELDFADYRTKQSNRIFIRRKPVSFMFTPFKVEIEEFKDGMSLLAACLVEDDAYGYTWSWTEKDLNRMLTQGFIFCMSALPGLYSDFTRHLLTETMLRRCFGNTIQFHEKQFEHAVYFEWLDKDDPIKAQKYGDLWFDNKQTKKIYASQDVFNKLVEEVAL